MECPYCLHQTHFAQATSFLPTNLTPRIETGKHQGKEYQIQAETLICPGCRGLVIEVHRWDFSSLKFDSTRVFPMTSASLRAPIEVPCNIAEDFNEANLVLQVSAKASAALARRCLQSILAGHGYPGRDLVKQISALLEEADSRKALPSALQDNVDAIRNFGNFSAHPITDQTSLEIIGVEEGEAEWCLQILRDLFDHFYVAPARAAERRASLAVKLTQAGKPPMK
jgi:hypothetical protein